jgi:hypothetical protein
MALIEAGGEVLILKRATASRSSGQWNDDDFDVLAGREVVGRIFKANAAPVGSLWMWTLAFEHHKARAPPAMMGFPEPRPLTGRVLVSTDSAIASAPGSRRHNGGSGLLNHAIQSSASLHNPMLC